MTMLVRCGLKPQVSGAGSPRNRIRRQKRSRRRGAALVEFAVIAPLFFLLVVGVIEFGRAMMVKQIITNAGSTIACEWDLPAAPMGQSFSRDLVKVDRSTSAGTTPLSQVATEAECAAGGWHLDNLLNPTKIVACPNTCMEMQNQSGGKIDVSFGCEAVGGCVPTGAATVDASTLASCSWAIPKPPSGQFIEPNSVNVRYSSPSGFATNLGKVASAADCATVQNGWYYDDEAKPTKILACPQTCTGVQAGAAAAKIEVLFGCETRPAVIE